jgi:hypothetical protein
VSLCVPSTANKTVTSASTTGTCATGSTAVALPASSTDQHTLLSILPHLTFQASGVDGKPTIQFSGANVQVINGTGSETTLNGEGNLVIGYDPAPRTQTGSHNLLLGTGDSSYTSYGGINAGFENVTEAPAASVLGGEENTASGPDATISGGALNVASGALSWIGGGSENGATGSNSSVTGGSVNTASGIFSVVGGGFQNVASGVDGMAGASRRQSVPVNFSNWSTPGCCESRFAQWYTDSSGIVHLEGAVTQTEPNSVNGSNPNLIGTLPAEARPPQTVYTVAHTNLGTYTDIAINARGEIFVIAPRPPAVTDFSFVSLEGITYRQ